MAGKRKGWELLIRAPFEDTNKARGEEAVLSGTKICHDDEDEGAKQKKRVRGCVQGRFILGCVVVDSAHDNICLCCGYTSALQHSLRA